MNWDPESVSTLFCWVIVLTPLASFILVGSIAALGLAVRERGINRLTQWGAGIALTTAIAMSVLMLTTGQPSIQVDLGHWVVVPTENFHFAFHFVFDHLSLTFLVLSLLLCIVVGAFARVYLHREAGYLRFYLLFAVFQLGMIVSSIAGTIETLFAGWELVGLSSALLVAFFQDRAGPVRSGLRVWGVYRISDAAFLAGAVALHHLAGAGDFQQMTGAGPWPHGMAPLSAPEAFAVGLLLLVAAAGKSALLPFSGWLPRAMDGPTPSSAIFYGALSIHLGAFLLLRVEPLLERSLPLATLVIVLGLATAIYASLVERTQTDIKSALAFASLTQVGLIVVEIGLGLRYLALAHIVGNACLRTLQLLRAPSLLHDYHQIDNAIGSHSHLPAGHRSLPRGRLSPRWKLALFRAGHQRDLFDIILTNWLVDPFLALMRHFNSLEEAWTRFLSGEARATSSPGSEPEPGHNPDPPPSLTDRRSDP